jgi:hypothetical protein
MNQNEPYTAGENSITGYFRYSVVLTIIAGLTLLAMTLAYAFWFESGIGPQQPIPFSHRIHATEKQISCVFCHSEAIDTDVAGIPPLETCMLCHSKIIIYYPQVADLRERYYNKVPSNERINFLQEFAYTSVIRRIYNQALIAANATATSPKWTAL